MRHASVLSVAPLLLIAFVGRAQQIPVTVASAEAEATAFPRDATPAVLPAAFSGSFTGSVERRCVQLQDGPWSPSLRSGEMIVRGHTGLRARTPGNKMLWMPLHDPGKNPVTLIIRGVRIDHPSDTLRQTIATERGPARGSGNVFGFPSTVIFPTAGRWLVVADDNHDWGCFILDVADPVNRGSH